MSTLPNHSLPVITMSSREIATLVESRHDKVKQSVERLANRGVISIPPMGEYLDRLGRKAHEYHLTTSGIISPNAIHEASFGVINSRI